MFPKLCVKTSFNKVKSHRAWERVQVLEALPLIIHVCCYTPTSGGLQVSFISTSDSDQVYKSQKMKKMKSYGSFVLKSPVNGVIFDRSRLRGHL